MDKADFGCEAIEAHANDHRKQQKGMNDYPMDTVDSDCEAIEVHANDHS
jgi:hypothetical protein